MNSKIIVLFLNSFFCLLQLLRIFVIYKFITRNMRPLITLSFFFIMISTITNASVKNNRIKLGNADLSVVIKGASERQLESMAIWVSETPIFALADEEETFRLERNGDIFSGSIPLELKEEIVGLLVEGEDSSFGTRVILRQDTPLILTVTVNKELRPLSLTSSDPEAPTPIEWDFMANALGRFLSSPYYIVPDSLYNDWREVRKYETTSLWPKSLEYALEGETLPSFAQDWFINSLKCNFASLSSLPYVAKAKRMNNLDVEAPPMESYSFLDSIDYSPAFLMHDPSRSLRPFLYALLRFPDGGFDKIGDTPIAVWQQTACKKLAKAIRNPDQRLLDLLSAMSYLSQIEVERIPLSPIQIANLEEGYADDLGKIVISRNNRMLDTLRKPADLLDLSAVDFSLEEYINSNYPGHPVIVDLWNTWCGPCLSAIKQVESLKKDIAASGIIFLYVSDVSSPLQAWESVGSRIGGIQIRISDASSRELGARYNLTGFPSYLFFDRDHRLIHGGTSFPGTPMYLELAKKIAE